VAKKIRKQKFYLLALIPFFAYLIIFKYYPMYGAIIAFKNFSFRKGILGSSWYGLHYFIMFFKSPDIWMVLRNTLAMSSLNIVLGAVFAILLAILISEIRTVWYKKIVQTISYLPHFISLIVVSGMAMALLASNGPVNTLIKGAGLQPVNFLGSVNMFWGLVTGLNIWQSVGWGSIIYIAAIVSIDPSMYESAILDGAGKFSQIKYITIPMIFPTIMILFIFSLGYILSAGFELQLFLQNPLNYTHAEVLDTYVFKYGLQKSMYSYAAAVGILKSIVGFGLVVIVNFVTRKFFKVGVF